MTLLVTFGSYIAILNSGYITEFTGILQQTKNLVDTYSECLIWGKKWLDSTLSDSRRKLHIQLSHRTFFSPAVKRYICLSGLIVVAFNQIFLSVHLCFIHGRIFIISDQTHFLYERIWTYIQIFSRSMFRIIRSSEVSRARRVNR